MRCSGRDSRLFPSDRSRPPTRRDPACCTERRPRVLASVAHVCGLCCKRHERVQFSTMEQVEVGVRTWVSQLYFSSFFLLFLALYFLWYISRFLRYDSYDYFFVFLPSSFFYFVTNFNYIFLCCMFFMIHSVFSICVHSAFFFLIVY